MHSKLAITGLMASTVAAYIDPHRLIARQTQSADPASGCLSAILEVVADAPYPPAPIVDVMTSFMMTATGTVDYQCGWQTNLPADLVDDWYDYQDEVMSWYTAHEKEMSSALAQCPADYSSSVGTCTKTIAGLPAPADSKPTGGSGGSGSGSGTRSPNAAPMQTGYVAVAAAAAAGFLGVVAAL